MSLRPPGFPPVSQADWDRWARNTAVVPDDNSVTVTKLADKVVTNAKLRDSVPASVIGRLQSTPGTPGDITASSDDTFLARRSGALTFGVLADSDIPATLARDTEVTAAIAAQTAASLVVTDARYVALANVLQASKTFDPPLLNAGDIVTTTVTVTGAVLGDFVLRSFSLDLQNITVTAYVSAADTVSVLFANTTAGIIDLGSGTLRVRVWKQ